MNQDRKSNILIFMNTFLDSNIADDITLRYEHNKARKVLSLSLSRIWLIFSGKYLGITCDV